MPYTIRVGKTGNAITYTLSQVESFAVETVTATVDTTGVAFGVRSGCDVIYRDNAGLLIARSRSSLTLDDGGTVTITFAPWLPDTQELGNADTSFTNQTGLCATILPPGGSVTVQATDAAAIVRGFQMWVDADVDAGAAADTEDEELGAWMFVPGPGV